ncbi:MAG: hypothetical protein K5859_09085 [Atopobiaceae bacterium]|nr:hypothetical protein [Atopobiaceae bacterium]
MAETNNKNRGTKARAAILAGVLMLAMTPAVAYAAGGAPAQMGVQNGAPSAREQVLVQDRMASDKGGMPQMDQMPVEGEQPPALPDGQMPVEGQEPPAMPDGEQPVEGQQPPALPNGEQPVEGELPPALPDGEQPVEGQQPPALPDGEQPVDGQQPPALPNGERPADGEQPPALPDNVSPMNGQHTSGENQQPAFNEELTPVQQFIKEFYSFFERILGISN